MLRSRVCVQTRPVVSNMHTFKTMGCFGIGAFWLMVTMVRVRADGFADEIQAECLENTVQFSVPGSLSQDGLLEVFALNNTEPVLLTPSLAAQCGYTLKSDPWRNMIVAASQWSCFAEDQGGKEFKVTLEFKPPGLPLSSENVKQVFKSCSYTVTSREILCETNFMEVSIRNAIPEVNKELEEQWHIVTPNLQLWKIILYTPAEMVFNKDTFQAKGYNVLSSPTRLVLRSPFNMSETFIQQVDQVDMMVFKSLVLFRDRWMMTIVETAAACPTNGDTVEDNMISWQVPLHITPLASSNIEILEVHMGVNGQRLTPEVMNSRNYTMTFTESHVVIQIPVGSPDGYYKSHALNDQYNISYTIEPMLELLWKEGLDMTTYKVLYPISTPVRPWPLQITDNTQPDLMLFDIELGSFLMDVELQNISFGSELRTVSEMIVAGTGLQEHTFPNHTKSFSLQVHFSDPYVEKKNIGPDLTTYILPLIFGFVILPDRTPFYFSTVLEASLTDVTVHPKAGGSCAPDRFDLYVIYGSTPSSQLQIKLGDVELNDELLQQFEHYSNETHFSIVVPFLSPVVAFESIQLTGIIGRTDIGVFDTINNWHLKTFSLSCPFLVKLSECFSNGTIAVLVPKLELVPGLQPGEMFLRDPDCKPYSNEQNFAYFHFGVTTCGTTRKFVEDTIEYENEVIWMSNGTKPWSSEQQPEPAYRFKISCIYVANSTQSISFQTVSQSKQLQADVGKGELAVSLRLSQDMVYQLFYHDDDYPVLKFLKQPLYFEVGMDHSRDSRIAIGLENCWATLTKDRESKPRWDLIIDGCANSKDPEQTILHSVMADDRVEIPNHYKRFEVKTFAFTKVAEESKSENDDMARRVFVHCDVIICHVKNTTDGRCFKQCAATLNQRGIRSSRVLRSTSVSEEDLQHVSIGPILFI